MARRRRKISVFGSVALLAGISAWAAATRGPIAGAGPVLIGCVGAALGLLAVVGSILLGNTGRLLPLLGLAACLSAAGYGMVAHGHGGEVAEQLQPLTDWFRRGAGVSAPGVAVPAPKTAAAPLKPPPAAEDGEAVGRGTIFDTSGVQNRVSSDPSAVKSSPPPVAPPAAPSATASQAPSQSLPEAMARAEVAKAKLQSAMQGLILKLARTPAYQAAKQEQDDAEAALKEARQSSDPGNPARVEASQRWINARAALQRVVNGAAASDEETVAAQQEWTEAMGNLQAIRAQQAPHPNAARLKSK